MARRLCTSTLRGLVALSALALAPPAFAADAEGVEDAERVETPENSENSETVAPVQAEAGVAEASSEAAPSPGVAVTGPELPLVDGAPPSDEIPAGEPDGIATSPRDVPEPRPPTDYGEEALGSSSTQAIDADRSLRLDAARGWRNAGIAGLTVGVVLIGGAIAIGSTNPADPRAGNSGFTDARNRGAWTMGTPGGLIAIGGVAMLTYGLLAQRRFRVGGRLDSESAGLEINWRF